MVELEISFAVFGVLLAGLCPIAVAELRHVSKLESRFKAGVTYYAVPRAQPWSQKLAGTATVSTTAPGSATSGPSGPNTVTVLSLEATPTVENATALVQVQAPVIP